MSVTMPGPYTPSLPATGADTATCTPSLAKKPPSPSVSVPPESVARAVKPTPTAAAPSAGTTASESNTRYFPAPHSASPAPAQPHLRVHLFSMRRRTPARVRPHTSFVRISSSDIARPPLRKLMLRSLESDDAMRFAGDTRSNTCIPCGGISVMGLATNSPSQYVVPLCAIA